ncbi:Wzy polymerase domain-containing protein [Paucibacter sediminis]|uniref:Wzy polymerase domain-containing protein n=1 Tax=Paucibacter sediminis TaxID=3019553 RepID=A0AA95NF90_9BURK|nr:O-antigen ligase family protein [Paucibacter sp. S2-9]WIT13134.1 Wzy polymerase domain-containing protein [Paucibacter sp. S2-9]
MKSLKETEMGLSPFLLALLACALPPLLAYNLTPSATLFNQLMAVAGWGLLVSVAATRASRLDWRASPAVGALCLLALAALSSPVLHMQPQSLALSSAALLLAAAVTATLAAALPVVDKRMWLQAFMWGLLLAGLVSALVSLVQVFMPDWADGNWIARSGIAGRAVGNMRQPNHLASLLIWACVAAVALAEVCDRPRAARVRVSLALGAVLWLLVLAMLLSASRTGMLAVLLLAAWGAFDRRLTGGTRVLLLSTPLMLACSWWLVSDWASAGQHAFGAESRLAEGAGSPSRLAVMSNAWALLKQHPLAGVGWGEFNLAWSMTPFPERPVAFFDHCHNLPLQLLVELGWPMGLLVLGLLTWSLGQAFFASLRADGPDAVMLRCVFMLVLMIGLHSLLEYPLWYAYFLLPTAFALGLSQGWSAPVVSRRLPKAAMQLAGVLMLAGSAYAARDYLSVVEVYAPSAHAPSLEQRIQKAQQSLFFSAQADYAAATSLPSGAEALEATRRTSHQLIDVRLMMAWANSLHAVGDDDKARYVVQRLKEFRSAQGAEWLAACDKPSAAEVLPFQCEAPSQVYGFEALR